jgi:hypothetical protein
LDAARIKGAERRARRLKGRAIDLAPLLIGLRERGMSLAKTAGELTRLKVPPDKRQDHRIDHPPPADTFRRSIPESQKMESIRTAI